MTKQFLDTNLIIYANDARDARKQARALEVVADAIRSGNGAISTQVMQEYAVVAASKLKQDLDRRYQFHASLGSGLPPQFLQQRRQTRGQRPMPLTL